MSTLHRALPSRFFALSLALCASAALAAPPPGSYTQSCMDSKLEGETLFAQCKNVRGAYSHTELHQVETCLGDISNQNGVLTCARAPAGSYRESCSSIQVQPDGITVTAQCKDMAGRNVSTELVHYDWCPRGLDNRNGQLVCPEWSIPRSAYSAECTNAKIENGALVADCKTQSVVHTSLPNFNACKRGIKNQNGTLECE